MNKTRLAVEDCKRPKLDPIRKLLVGATYDEEIACNVQLAKKVRKTRMGRLMSCSSTNRQTVEEAERRRWVLELASFIEEAGLPVMTLFEDEITVQLWERLFGARRARTLRNRPRAWKAYSIWSRMVYGRIWPANCAEVINYLQAEMNLVVLLCHRTSWRR